MSKKLWSVLGLCLVFAVVLFAIYGLAEQRGYYRSSALLDAEGYRMIIRSVKYGMVLVVLVFASFFLSEVLQEWRIHPVQYLLVGAALSIFYLLLLSLAEHIGFTAAYCIGAFACISLLCWYLHFVLATTRGVYMMTALLTAAYGAMFVLVRMQQYNLLVGSCLLFATLFAVMYYTREIDWYALGGEAKD
ncbi:inner membrane CreD family protein [Eikenella sp. S3360]|uniref:Inner membrane CreD family protein n=1 Tax=Eikenella glucosivorans TaxID=2766967 RepID=A0ABS0N728_9NEIS|nr:inner membrane CreD family protein [Eikenella glucosivorans]MBH5328085.1 inner membrane CreD family protein [Eikenella glucosivorans]